MAELEAESLENLLNRATNPANQQEDWDGIMAFCDQINKELEGPQIAIRLLAHKIQSPQSKESLYALATLEASVKNCGRRFHQEIGKFRFLNEMIKVVSPKYLGNHTSEAVKKKCIELLYGWSSGLKHEPKVLEAYQMLKRQGIVKDDPTYIDQTLEPPPPARAKDALFEDEEKSKMLARLLKSKHPEDLQAANRLIKNMVKQDMERMEKKSKRMQELETVSNNIKLLSEMLNHYSPDTATSSELDVMKELYDNIEKRRPNLFRLASDADDKDGDAMSEILKVNDDVVKVMTQYKKVVEGKTEENGLDTFNDPNATPMIPPGPTKNASSLLDLEFEGASSESNTLSASLDPLAGDLASASGGDTSLLDDQLTGLGIGDTDVPAAPVGKVDYSELSDIFGSLAGAAPTQNNTPDAPMLSGLDSAPLTASSNTSGLLDMGGLVSAQPLVPQSSNPAPFSATSQPQTTSVFDSLTASAPSPAAAATSGGDQALITGILTSSESSSKQTNVQPKSTASSGLDDLAELGLSLIQKSLADSGKSVSPALFQSSQATKVPMNQMVKTSTATASAPISSIPAQPASMTAPAPVNTAPTVQPLTDIVVALEAIQPSTHAPVSVYDKNSVKIMLHVAKNEPRPDVIVMALSVISTNTLSLKSFSFQAAVPKSMKVKLQPASGTELPGFNPILPPSALSQIMLIANPQKEKIRLKYRVAFTIDNNEEVDVGEIDSFPVP